jgi:hypothetical protein
MGNWKKLTNKERMVFMKKLLFLIVAAMFAVVLMGCSDEPDDSQTFDGTQTKLKDLKYHNGKIYAAYHYFDLDWEPAKNSVITEFNETGITELRTFESNFMNVMQIEIRGNYLFVVDHGSYFAIEGGVTKINLTNGAKETVLDAKTVGANPAKVEFVSDDNAFWIMSKSWDNSYVTDNSFSPIAELSAINPVLDISYNSSTNSLWIASGNKVYSYSLANKSLDSISTQLPVTSIKSVGATTLTIESDYFAGKYGIIKDGNYNPGTVISGDAYVDFVDGNFYILERSFVNNLISLTPDGNIIRQLPLDAIKDFNAHGICGNGKGKIFVGSYGGLIISVFELE